jgi:hypothetical protein
MALASPQLLPEFRSAKAEKAGELNKEATDIFEQGTKARQHSDEYVRATVTLATVLLLTSISQRFKTHKVRVGLAVVALIILCLPVFHILTLPRA